MRYTQARTIAGRGMTADRFHASVHAITIGPDGALHAAGDSEIKVFDPRGTLRRRWKTANAPYAVAIAPDGRVFAGGSGLIEIFDAAGRLEATWHDPQRLGRVTAIGFAGGDVLAADAAGRAIRRLDRAGRFLNDIGNDNRTQGFVIPNGVLDFSVDDERVIHASNPGKHRIERYAVDGRLLGRIGRFGPDPEGFPGCCNPTNVTVAGHGRIYVTEKAGPRVKALAPDGSLLAIIASDVFDPNCKNMDVAVDARGAVYVVDTVTLAIHVFAETADA